MKSKTYKKILEVLPMKKCETLANIKTNANLSLIPDELTANLDDDLLFVLVNKISGEFLGWIKLNYEEESSSFCGIKGVLRTATLTMSEFSSTIKDNAYQSMLKHLMGTLASYGKFVHYVHVEKETVSDRMISLLLNSFFKPLRGAEHILERNIALEVSLFMLIFMIVVL